jgi:hypothetical protein
MPIVLILLWERSSLAIGVKVEALLFFAMEF